MKLWKGDCLELMKKIIVEENNEGLTGAQK